MPQSKHQGPVIYLSGLPRSTSKTVFKALYSLTRYIFWRDLEEREKVITDLVLFGSGLYSIDEDGLKHIPLEERYDAHSS